MPAETLAGAKALSHRGPDNQQAQACDRGRLVLGHARLSILDLGEAAHQPFQRHGSDDALVFNGEIYNHEELRNELSGAGIRFSTQSDTEVLLVALQQWGVEATVRKLHGMFAFAWWNENTGELVLGRDRLGEKPLLIARSKQGIAFASEMRAFSHWRNFEHDIRPESVEGYLLRGCVPGHRTIFEQVVRLPPGTTITFPAPDSQAKPSPFWSARNALNEPLAVQRSQVSAPDPEFEGLELLLTTVLKRQLLADVPVGVFLSGGIDSSLVTALAVAASEQTIKSFSMGFDESSHDESRFAEPIAEHLGTEHKTIRVAPDDLIDLVELMARVYDEPFADSSQIPTTLLCQRARKYVTVAITGDGGDEVFGGYNRHIMLARADNLRRQYATVRLAARLGRLVPNGALNLGGRLAGSFMSPAVDRHLRRGTFAPKAKLMLGGLSTGDWAPVYDDVCSVWNRGEVATLPETDVRAATTQPAPWPKGVDSVTEMRLRDLETYLPDDILVKVDRAAMSCGLETRTPFLDQDVVQYGIQTPTPALIRGGLGKIPLRTILSRHVPENLWNRPKAGFAAPIAEWLRGPLHDWAQDLVEATLRSEEPIIAPERLQKTWDDHVAGRADNHQKIWTVLMFQAWLRFQDAAPDSRTIDSNSSRVKYSELRQ